MADGHDGQCWASWPMSTMANKSNSERLRGFDDGQTETFAILESLSQLKILL